MQFICSKLIKAQWLKQHWNGGLYPRPGVPSGSMQIHMDCKEGVELTFTYVLASAVHMDLHGSTQIPSEIAWNARIVLGQFHVNIYVCGLGWNLNLCQCV
jgi:hypothetical protein